MSRCDAGARLSGASIPVALAIGWRTPWEGPYRLRFAGGKIMQMWDRADALDGDRD